MTSAQAAVSAAKSAVASVSGADNVAPLTAKKVFKDLVADFLLTWVATFGTIELFTLPVDQPGWVSLGMGVATAFVKAAYRAVLRWSLS